MNYFSKRILFTAAIVLGLTSLTVSATTENALICQACNYQQAQQLAIHHATPALHCFAGDGEDAIRIENQSCISQPRRLVVFDANSRQAYPFEVYHTNQGLQAFDMEVAIRDRVIHPENLKLLNVGVDMQYALNNAIHELANTAIERFSQASSSANAVLGTFSSNMVSTVTADSCANDRDAAALKAALNERTRAELQQYVQERHRGQIATNLDAFMSYFDRNTASLSSVSFKLSKGIAGVSYGVNASFEITPKTTNFTVIYNTANDLRFFATKGQSGWLGYPQLVYSIGPNADGTQVVKTDDEASFIDGVSLSAIKNYHNSTVPLEVSPCIGLQLQQLDPNIQFEPPASNGGGAWGGTNPGSGSGSSGGSGATCTLFGKVNGTIVLVMRVMC